MAHSLSQFVWETRYRCQSAGTTERSIEETWARVAAAAAAVEKDVPRWSDTFLAILRDYRFLPGGRILAGAGAGRVTTLCNCFVMGLIEDCVEGIFDALKEGALTLQQGGGVGYDFSTLRPRGSRTRTTGMIASGPVSFMRVWDAMSATMTSTGSRRGAMMATLRCDHPDLEEFITAKRDTTALRHFNLSVQITDDFMAAIRADGDWPLLFPERTLEDTADTAVRRIERSWSGSAAPISCRILRTLPARTLWRRICDSAQQCGEPGVLFVDRINAQNNLGYRETLSATNPCGEVPLPPYGACDLGSINLAAFVRHPFDSTAALDVQAIGRTAGVAVRFLDNVIDIAQFPLFRQREQTHATRRIGLGITGLADALAMLGLRYDSEAGRQAAVHAMRAIRDAAYGASIEIARSKGPFPHFERERYLERPFIRALPETLRSGIEEHGIRNSHLTAIAPAGSISLLAGNVSSGIEPIFRLRGTRRVLQNDGSHRNFEVSDFAYARWRELHPYETEPPDFFIEGTKIAPADHLAMQAALQPFVDGAISKTIALRAETSAADVEWLYATAYELGLKGCTVFRQRGLFR